MNTISKKTSTNNELLVTFLSVISFFYFILVQIFIPARFHFDSGTIRSGMVNPLSVGGSFRTTANLFKNIGLRASTPSSILVLLSWIIFIFLMFTMIKINDYQDFSKTQIILLTFFMLMYGFYFTDYSKDIIVLVFLSIAIDLPAIHKNILINILLAIFIYGYFFRDYWKVIATISLIPLIIKNVKIKRDLEYIFFAIILFIICYDMIKHGYITHVRINANITRLNSPDAKSMINNLVSSTSIFNDIINYIYVLISLFLPIQGLPSVNMIIYYLWIWGIMRYFIKYKSHVNWRLIFILVIYINIQALFEPDFGSVLRHQLAWFPVLFYAIKYINITRKSKNLKGVALHESY